MTASDGGTMAHCQRFSLVAISMMIQSAVGLMTLVFWCRSSFLVRVVIKTVLAHDKELFSTLHSF
jgi:hypothetical protein